MLWGAAMWDELAERRVRLAHEAGRCDAVNGIVDGVRRRSAEFPLTAVGCGPDGERVEVPVRAHAKDVAAVRKKLGRDGVAWDGTVVDPWGNASWLDEETVRGNYPRDCPRWLRHRIGQLAAGLGRVDVATKVRVAVAARQRGWKISDRDIVALLRDGQWAYACDNSGETRTVRGLGAADADELARFARLAIDDPDDRDLLLEATRDPRMLTGVFTKSGRLTGVRGVVTDGRVGRAVATWAHNGLPYDLDAAVLAHETHLRETWRGGRGVRCFTCQTDQAACGCACGNDARLAELRRAARVHPTQDHAWGHEHSVAATAAMREAAARHAATLERRARAVDGDAADALEAAGGPDVWRSIALYFEQTQVADDERDELLGDALDVLVSLLETTSARADAVHADYVAALYREFDAGDAPLGELGLTELYLGRDGGYLEHARDEMLREYVRRGDARAVRHATAYVSVSSASPWEPRDHRHIAGPTVLIDTGFTGTIPARIAAAQGLRIVDGDVKAGEVAVRLLNTDTPGMGFSQQAPFDVVGQIEHDAKLHRQALRAGELAPSSAIEQLVCRQLEHTIRTRARAQIAALLDAETGGGQRGGWDTPADAAFWRELACG